jgi:deoxyribodipyrimidine photo-lyase
MNISVFWHRRDLRIEDNAGLYYALKNSDEVHPVFIFDSTILEKLPKNDQRVLFIHQEIELLKTQYKQHGGDLSVYFGNPVDLIPQIILEKKANALYTNRDYESYALARDKSIYEILLQKEISFKGFKDHVIFEKSEVVKSDGLPYTVFTPYMKQWKAKLTDFYIKAYPVEKYLKNLAKNELSKTISLEEMGFSALQEVQFPSKEFSKSIITNYAETRDIPSLEGTSKLSVHLRFGTISIRKLTRFALKHNEKYLNELIWRDFYQMILFHFPHSEFNSFRPIYDRVPWKNNETHFKAWCEGKTGYPLVDAGMRELNKTGHMHNRVRMVVASFLTKHLLIDWRWGERYFAEKLLDFELASNIGGWQWAAGSGCDAAPYFRVFNPSAQVEKFDPQFKYVKHWIPEYGNSSYPTPIVEHKEARLEAIATYKKALSEI